MITNGDTVDAGDRATHVDPPFTEYSYVVTADPPEDTGAVNATDTWPLPAVATTDVGAPGSMLDSSFDALMMPGPQVFDASASHAPPGNVVTLDEVVIRERICAGVKVPFMDFMSATTPATCGVAMLVPL